MSRDNTAKPWYDQSLHNHKSTLKIKENIYRTKKNKKEKLGSMFLDLF